ncbi:MAG: hypothetical protein ACOYJL_04740 [Tractidigestivibacter sp.]|jgi:hypothetical protein|uniref:hypothetical protein n=1 Tax=Tractidigestivibacter sp. TaxID=2847320 RepID=UPI003D89D690
MTEKNADVSEQAAGGAEEAASPVDAASKPTEQALEKVEDFPTQLAAAKKDYDQASEELRNLTSAHNTLVEQKKTELSRVVSAHNQSVKELENKFKELQDSYSGEVASAGPVVLYHNRLRVGKNLYGLLPDLKVEVNSSGTIYATSDVSGGGMSLGGAIVGGAVAGPAGAVVAGRKPVKSETTTHDDRHLYFTVSSSEGGESIELDPSLEQQARNLAAKVPACVAAQDKLEKEVAPKIYDTKELLEKTKADVADVNAAQQALDEATSNTAELDQAKSRADKTLAAYQALLEKDPERVARKKSRQRAAGIALLVLAAFVVLMGWGTVFEYPSAANCIVIGLLAFVLVFIGLVKLDDGKKKPAQNSDVDSGKEAAEA